MNEYKSDISLQVELSDHKGILWHCCEMCYYKSEILRQTWPESKNNYHTVCRIQINPKWLCNALDRHSMGKIFSSTFCQLTNHLVKDSSLDSCCCLSILALVQDTCFLMSNSKAHHQKEQADCGKQNGHFVDSQQHHSHSLWQTWERTTPQVDQEWIFLFLTLNVWTED